MIKDNIVHKFSERLDINLSVSRVVADAIVGAIQEALIKEEKLTILNFGSFKRRKSKERKGRNPKSLISYTIPSRYTVGFKPAQAFVDKALQNFAKTHK